MTADADRTHPQPSLRLMSTDRPDPPAVIPAVGGGGCRGMAAAEEGGGAMAGLTGRGHHRSQPIHPPQTSRPAGQTTLIAARRARPHIRDLSTSTTPTRHHRVEAVLGQPAHHRQAPQRPPLADHRKIDISAVAGHDITHAPLVPERQNSQIDQGITVTRLRPVRGVPMTSSPSTTT